MKASQTSSRDLPNRKLEDERDPEPRVAQRADTGRDIRGDRTRTDLIRRKRSRTYSGKRTKNLRDKQREANVHTRQGLQKDHAKTETLQRIQDT